MMSEVESEAEPELDHVKVNKVVQKVLDNYMADKNFISTLATKYPTDVRSLLLIIECKDREVHFGVVLQGGQLRKFTPEEYNIAPPKLIRAYATSKTFIKVLVGHDDYGIPYDVDYAWCNGDVRFDGMNNVVTRVVLSDIFAEFKAGLTLPK